MMFPADWLLSQVVDACGSHIADSAKHEHLVYERGACGPLGGRQVRPESRPSRRAEDARGALSAGEDPAARDRGDLCRLWDEAGLEGGEVRCVLHGGEKGGSPSFTLTLACSLGLLPGLPCGARLWVCHPRLLTEHAATLTARCDESASICAATTSCQRPRERLEREAPGTSGPSGAPLAILTSCHDLRRIPSGARTAGAHLPSRRGSARLATSITGRTGRNRFSQPMHGRRPPSDQRVLISTTEAAKQLGVSTAKVRRWIERGHLESFRIAGRRRYFVDQLEVGALRVISEEHR